MANPFPNTFEQPLKKVKDDLETKVTLLQTEVNTVKTLNRQLFGGTTFVAAVDLGLRSLVRFDAAGQLIPATDNNIGGSAVGIIDAPVNAGNSSVIYGSGVSFADVGLAGVVNGSEIFLGLDGVCSIDNTGSPRLIQRVAIVVNNQFIFDFHFQGVWVAS